jgi:hypothetical protein
MSLSVPLDGAFSGIPRRLDITTGLHLSVVESGFKDMYNGYIRYQSPVSEDNTTSPRTMHVQNETQLILDASSPLVQQFQ